MTKQRILAVDDDKGLLSSIKKTLELSDYSADVINDPTNVAQIENLSNYHAVLLDIKMPKLDGNELLRNIHSNYPHIPVIMISGESDIKTAVESIKDGAYDFIEKPIDPDKLLITIKNAISIRNLYDENIRIKEELSNKYRIIFASNAMNDVLNKVNNIAKTRAKVIIYGESGTGKELIARAIHEQGDRKDKPYIKINCASIPSELLESEFFGHKKGSFTGASKRSRWKIYTSRWRYSLSR
ncbi:MAG: sigma 54-interacting transcriptional regulator [Melioribacteraceae bacterium]|nr:sigma 54-interacting transcriptional regulator [Melioribacteraceae bacterium]